MKINVIEQDGYKLPFPCLMRSNSSGIIVYFLNEFSGVRIDTDNPEDIKYSDKWAIDTFEPFDGIIQLQNDQKNATNVTT